MKNISFEFFPPKTKEGLEKLGHTAKKLATVKPDYFSVTFGAGGSTREGTFETVKFINEITNIKAVPHISCVGADANEIRILLDRYQQAGVDRLVVLRGDVPSGMGLGSQGTLRYASELVALIRQHYGNYFYIDVAAYPECHPEAIDLQQDLINLKRKIDAGANSAITQYFFNADGYFEFIEQAQRMGIDVPIVPGIMPIMNFEKLLSFSNRCGAEIPRWLQKRLAAFNGDAAAMRAFGIDFMTCLCKQLLTGGAPGLHFYTLNQADASLKIIERLG